MANICQAKTPRQEEIIFMILRSIFKYPLKQEILTNKTSEQHMRSISDWWIGIMICVLGLIGNLVHILQNTTTVVGITHRGHGFEGSIYIWLVIPDKYIHTKLLCGGGGRIEYKSKRVGLEQIE